MKLKSELKKMCAWKQIQVSIRKLTHIFKPEQMQPEGSSL